MANKTVIVKDKDILIEKTIEKGLSYRQLAIKANTSPTTICLILNGERNPSPNTAVNICRVLECEFNDIFFIKNVDNSKQKWGNKNVNRQDNWTNWRNNL